MFNFKYTLISSKIFFRLPYVAYIQCKNSSDIFLFEKDLTTKVRLQIINLDYMDIDPNVIISLYYTKMHVGST